VTLTEAPSFGLVDVVATVAQEIGAGIDATVPVFAMVQVVVPDADAGARRQGRTRIGPRLLRGALGRSGICPAEPASSEPPAAYL